MGLDAFYFTRADFVLAAAANVLACPVGNDFFQPKARGQNRIVRTIAQTMPQPIHVMFGWAACHSRICL